MALSTIRSLRPESPTLNTPARGLRRAFALFHEAARRVPAYRDFLKKRGVKASSIRTVDDFKKIPRTDKPSYIQAYDIKDLSWDGNLDIAKVVSTSSGSTGVPFFWPRGYQHDVIINCMIQKMYEDIVGTGKGSTLAVDSFALGQWIAGFEFYNATRWAAERGNHIVALTPGIDKIEAAFEIKKLSPYFDRVVIGGYPPFIKDIIEQGALIDIDWAKIDLYLIGGGESVSDVWKDRLLEKIGRPGEIRRYISEYGMAEAGVVGNETPVSAALRRALPKLNDPFFPRHEEVVGLYQFYPGARYFEAAEDGSLSLTTDSGLPLIRYDTRDIGGVLEYEEARKRAGGALKEVAAQYGIDISSWKLPFVYLKGRRDFSISLYALNIYVENVKHALEHSPYVSHLSGLFIMEVGHTESMDQEFRIIVELAPGTDPSANLQEELSKDIVDDLCRLNAEYAKLYATLKERARPKIVLIKNGALGTIPGRKHRYVKK